MNINSKEMKPVMVVVTYGDGGIKVFSAADILANENLENAESSIRDTDMADEMAEQAEQGVL